MFSPPSSSFPSLLAQTPPTAPPVSEAQADQNAAAEAVQPFAIFNGTPKELWIASSAGLLLMMIVFAVISRMQIDKLKKQIRFDGFKNQELRKKLKLANQTITRMETNPDLIHSREFNLDYLRMRMADEQFNFAVLNQIRVKVKDKIATALRPTQAQNNVIGIAATGRQVDETFDIEQEMGHAAQKTRRVLFRIQVRLVKIPTQPTSQTVAQIIDCMESYLKPDAESERWQPTIQGRLAQMHWDQKAKPTPLLVLEQTSAGTNVTFATRRGGDPATLTPEQAMSRSTKTRRVSHTNKGPSQNVEAQQRSKSRAQPRAGRPAPNSTTTKRK